MFFVLEITVDNGTGKVEEPIQAETRDEAESAYYSILANASISTHQIHGAVILAEDGMPIAYKSYRHEETTEEITE